MSQSGASRQTHARPARLAGIFGGLVGSTCCIGPAVGVATGAGAGTFLLAMGRYRPLLFVVGGIVALLTAVLLLRRETRVCEIPATDQPKLRSRWIDATLIAFALTYAFGRFIVASAIERL